MSGTQISDALIGLGLASAQEKIGMTPLAGGVSSDIWRVDLAAGPICVKRALPRLKVSAVWEAPIERNRYEYEWLRIASAVDPACAPRLLALGEGWFAMEFLRHPVWKAMLREGIAEPSFARKVGGSLRAIHDATAGRQEIADRFPTDAIFHAIRIEPYLLATASRHPDLASYLSALAERTASTKVCLVHGDVSPKNILVGSDAPVFLDAECAWYGDPAFDLAFCLNHLLLKCLWVPMARARFLQCFDAMAEGYDPAEDVERRTASLLPALLLARVDGKSPVEYLDASGQDHVRRTAKPLIVHPPSSLVEIAQTWQKSLT
ncbi:MAG: aminoglycoside phosphotransferase family protein [Betaproteobacteria bacterium]|nr:aminoglycoside phosphotransferase family protein [Betaproteobacteria bacterium]